MKSIRKFSSLIFFVLALTLGSCREKSEKTTYTNIQNGMSYSFVFNGDSTFSMHYHSENQANLGRRSFFMIMRFYAGKNKVFVALQQKMYQ